MGVKDEKEFSDPGKPDDPGLDLFCSGKVEPLDFGRLPHLVRSSPLESVGSAELAPLRTTPLKTCADARVTRVAPRYGAKVHRFRLSAAPIWPIWHGMSLRSQDLIASWKKHAKHAQRTS